MPPGPPRRTASAPARPPGGRAARRLPGRREWRLAAARGLGFLGDPRAIPELVRALADAQDVVAAAALALGWLGDRRVVLLVARTLGRDFPAGRCEAPEILGRLGEAWAVRPLRRHLDRCPSDPHLEPYRAALAAALERLEARPG